MTMPTPLCPHRMQVHSLRRETPDVWTLNLICPDFYPYRPGQYALVSIDGSEETLRAYTLSSTPGLSPFITLTVRRLDNGVGSGWLTGRVRPGDELWLSPAQGSFTCPQADATRYLMLAAGCGVTPIISMTRWLLVNRPSTDVAVIYAVRTPRDLIFADEWHQLADAHPQLQLILLAEAEATGAILPGRLNRGVLQGQIRALTERTVMICGPAPYMQQAQTLVGELGVSPQRVHQEIFRPQVGNSCGGDLRITSCSHPGEYRTAVGVTLLHAMEQNRLPVQAACRAGVCGCCKTRILHGDYQVSSTMTLTPQEIAQGYVLACSCQLESDITLA
ncbi:NADH oxidoreductase [Edwardsiella ictaluri]|uniref:Oxidoreductase, putative n=1 Tax=Edwardsiella ictaluri (strain 93-146) TaxID=634503 RepID=C5BEB0_EDWI9|nr:NADH oxidoreductase [Edwardsiella ictaluri]ACR69671.2 oxidoreductase, putative [Edwardsiella ictaluri 93-146]AVZ83343.1 NADH oxidoreductase [Edwardsiella ictaluri]EKS7761775.1 NADH oxidoreductase [Edwardsiella ictaluri]EKS7768585.1 NADH oxidoreductase [Edwardsiella ictaluri]EKS7772097.1 NADH oxidoreductase [Edwardsiella ictaluri]